MAKRPKSRRRPRGTKNDAGRASGDRAGTLRATSAPDPTTPRNPYLDALRGLAILLMVVDHVSGILLEIPIQGSYVRSATRLSMPLFCVLMGFFLRPTTRFFSAGPTHWPNRRLLQIAAAAVAANLVFWPHYQCIEILGSLLIAYLICSLTGYWFARPAFQFFVLAILLYPVDPICQWVDYPVTMVVSFVAHGMILRRSGFVASLLSGAMLTGAGFWIGSLEPFGVNDRLCMFVLPATLLVHFGDRLGKIGRPSFAANLPFLGLDWIGQHPLSAYLLQYYVVFLIAYWIAP